MGSRDGNIELDWAVDAIVVGTRHRTDLGDIDALASSIDRHGLLQPLTLTSQGVLVCGYRRLTAIKKLNWRTTGVWIRSGVSDRLGHLLAEQDDNNHHKALTQTEAAALYRETKTLMAEDAARRKKATQFSSDNQPGNGGPANLAGPSPADAAEAPAGAMGTAREQAARLITGRASYTTLERTGFLQQLLEDPATAEHVRAEAATGLVPLEANQIVPRPGSNRSRPAHPSTRSTSACAPWPVRPPSAARTTWTRWRSRPWPACEPPKRPSGPVAGSPAGPGRACRAAGRCGPS